MIDQRTETMTGVLSDMSDIDVVYRELCDVHSYNFSKAKAHTDSQQKITISGLLKLCILLNLKLHIDAMKDTFTVWYPEKGEKPVKIVLDKETEKMIEDNNPEIKESENSETEEEAFDKVKFTEIKKDPVQRDMELEDMFD